MSIDDRKYLTIDVAELDAYKLSDPAGYADLMAYFVTEDGEDRMNVAQTLAIHKSKHQVHVDEAKTILDNESISYTEYTYSGILTLIEGNPLWDTL